MQLQGAGCQQKHRFLGFEPEGLVKVWFTIKGFNRNIYVSECIPGISIWI